MREEFGLIGGHIDVDRAVALAALAREAQVERLFDVLILPPVLQRILFEHLEEQSRASTRGMHLLSRDHETRAHRAVLEPAAFSDADAP